MYVGLPLTLKQDLEFEFVKERITQYVESSEKLWSSRAPIQVKYHLQRMCIDSEVYYAQRATKWRPSFDTSWVREIQARLHKTWTPITSRVPKKFLRIPIKYYGIGMFNIEDRWRIARKTYKSKQKRKDRDVGAEYYKNKIRKWIERRSINSYDMDRVAPRINLSITTPPNTKFCRLNDDAFVTMLLLRYNSQAADGEMSGIDPVKKCKCPYHPSEDLTLQHAVSCAYLGKRHVIEQHDRICQVVAGILKKNKYVTDVKRESYTEEQWEKLITGNGGHKADIVYKCRGIVESVDVIATSSNNNKRGNNVTRTWSTKEREYRGENNLHIVLMDTAGNIAEES